MTATVEQLKERIELFTKNLKDYKSKNYDEYKTRADFIDVMFSSLGWDMYNEQKIIEQFREVVREDKIVIDGSKKAPDYSFRIGPHIVFYVEAKKPSVDIKNDPEPALQLRRYAHTRGLALSILTDFEEIAVYDTRIKPDRKDSASVARVFYCTFDELFLPCKMQGYETNYDFLLNTFGKLAVLNGSFNRYVETNKKGTTSVDRGFLDLLNKWRQQLAENIALKNEDIDEYNLNIVVQKLIDRLIFLRIAEDRLIEKPDNLREIAHRENVYSALNNIFAVADVKYNSSLFTSEAWMVVLNIEDKVLNEIIDEMYPPKCPYEFSVLPIEILGHAYEQFLGKTIKFTRKTKFGHSIEIEEKPEVRKAGGVYYTPDYIVDYIVENTVGEKINPSNRPPNPPEGDFQPAGRKGLKPQALTPEEIASIRILDPACGSGSFLIGAYDYLIRYHLEYYLGNTKRRNKALSEGIIYEAGENKYKLSSKVKSQILVNNIYGVDIDPQAVEVTKLSLLLKVLEDENLEYREQLFKTEQLHMLPDLSTNIKCGNSLIGSDYYADKNMTLFGNDEMRKVNAFDWEEQFKEVFKTSKTSPPGPLSSEARGSSSGGFDCVIGNPPWGAGFNQEEKEYFRVNYKDFHVRTPESFNYFIGRISHLIHQKGITGLIIPSSFLNQHEFWKTRKYLVENTMFLRVCNIGDGVFEKVTAPSCIIIFSKDITLKSSLFFDFRKIDRNNLFEIMKEEKSGCDAKFIGKDSESFILQVRTDNSIFNKCYKWKPLSEIAEDVATGVSSGLDKAFIYNINDVNELGLEKEILKKIIIGGEINRYSLKPESQKFIIYATKEVNIEYFPNCFNSLKKYHDKLSNRVETKSGIIPWYSLYRPRRKKLFENPKILIRQTADRILASYDNEKWYCLKSGIIIQLPQDTKIHYYYILGLLNSRLMKYLYDDLVGEQARVFPEVKPVQLFKLPIRTINVSDLFDKKLHDTVVVLVEQMLESQKQLSAAKSDSDRKLLQQKIDAIDKQIDALVYDLYGLTEDEVRIVEGGA